MTNPTDNLEAAIIAAGATAPRVTPEELQANITHTEIVKHISPSGQILRWAVITTRNGFAVAGRPSAAASSANDRRDIGERVAIENARAELWQLMGYALRERLAATPTDFRDRVRAEAADLDERIEKLTAFLSTDAFAALPLEEQHSLTAQQASMLDYSGCLAERIQRFA